MKSTRHAGIWVSSVLMSSSILACGAAPDGGDGASTGATSEALRNCNAAKMNCDPPDPTDPPVKPPPVKSPPPPSTCGFSAMSVPVASTCWMPYNSVSDPTSESVTDLGCVDNAKTDQLSVIQRAYIGYGCSNPVYWYAVNPYDTTNWGNAYVQMCPDSAAVAAYTAQLNAGGILPYPAGADHAPHTDGYPGGFCDAKLPHAKPGYVWVVPWMDPKCAGLGYCMVEAF